MMSRKTVNIIEDRARLEAKTKRIEESLLPLIRQLVKPDPNYSAHMAKGRSKSVTYLLDHLIDSIDSFVKNSNQIAQEYPEIQTELKKEIKCFKDMGNVTVESSHEFATDPYDTSKRKKLSENAQRLLCTVARILALADLIDNQSIVRYIENMLNALELMRNVKTESEFVKHFKYYGENLKHLLNHLSNSVANMDESRLKDEIVSIRSFLVKQSLFLYTSSKTRIKYPKTEDAISFQAVTYKQTQEALNKLLRIYGNQIKIEELGVDETSKFDQLLNAFTNLERLVSELNASKYKENKDDINKQLEETIRQVMAFSEQNLTESNTKNRLVDECHALSKAMQDLFDSYRNKESPEQIEHRKSEFLKYNKSIRKQLRKAIIEQFSTQNHGPLEELINAAKSGNKSLVEEKIVLFTNYANRLIELSLIASSLSSNVEGNQMVRVIVGRLRSQIPHVCNAARILCSHKASKEAQQNMSVLDDSWINEVKLLTLAIDDILSVNDFLLICENEIYNDINKCLMYLRACKPAEFRQTANLIAQRCARICEMVGSEMSNYEPCEFTRNVLQTVTVLREKLMYTFQKCVQYSSEAISVTPARDTNENEFIESSRKIYYCVRELRNELIQIPQMNTDELNLVDEEVSTTGQLDDKEEVQSQQGGGEYENNFDEEEDDDDDTNNITSNTVDSNGQMDQQDMKQELLSFRKEKNKFDREVLKWDDKSNDIIVLSKAMCVILMDMSVYTRGRGPFKSIGDVIGAAKKISEIGSKLEKLCRELANDCPESQSKKDLLDYLKSLLFFCNQINICVKVKENIIDPETATTLIISCKNLMNTVISVVNTSYIASTKYLSKTSNKKPIVQWKMKPPELKPLVPKSKPTEMAGGLVRKASRKNPISAIKALSEFQM